MKPPNKLSDADLSAYADKHIGYEIGMLLWTTRKLDGLAAMPELDDVAEMSRNVLLNSYAMHARNLIHFLYARSPGSDAKVWPTDVVVQDYIPEDTLATSLPQDTDCLKEATKKADKQVAHLTRERIKLERSGKEWNVAQITSEIMAALGSIAPHFPRTRTSAEFRQMIQQTSESWADSARSTATLSSETMAYTATIWPGTAGHRSQH